MVFLNFYLIGMFFNLFAPGTVGGDISRIYYLARDQEGGREKDWGGITLNATVSVFVDRVIGMMVLVWLGALGLILFPQYAVPSAVRLLTFALALGFIVGGLLIPVLRRILPAVGYSTVVKLRVALRSYRARWQAIPQAIALSFVIHLIQAWIHLLIGRAIHIEIPFSYCIILYPLVGTFAAIPITLNGLGLREGGYLFLLAVIGINSEKAIAFGVLLFLAIAADSLVGGVVFLLKKSPKPSVIVADTKIQVISISQLRRLTYALVPRRGVIGMDMAVSASHLTYQENLLPFSRIGIDPRETDNDVQYELVIARLVGFDTRGLAGVIAAFRCGSTCNRGESRGP